MRLISFTPDAFEQFCDWRDTDKKIQNKIIKLIEDVHRNPFEGLGKPEPLKHNFKGFWSRRINDEHRLVYEVTNEQICIVGCKYHY
jgi:toxin YoeB